MRGWSPYGDEESYRPTAYYYGSRRPQRITFSGTEIAQLGMALVILSAAFAMFLGGITLENQLSRGGLGSDGFLRYFVQESFVNRISFPGLVLISVAAVATGFLLHELAHKVVAQRYGLWAEFRASLLGLMIGPAAVWFLSFIFALPGAVVISGFVNRRENGWISTAGPGTNILIAYLALPFSGGIGGADTYVEAIARVVMVVNTGLCLFNMLPVWNLDGKKVLRWNPFVYFGIIAMAIAAFLWPVL